MDDYPTPTAGPYTASEAGNMSRNRLRTAVIITATVAFTWMLSRYFFGMEAADPTRMLGMTGIPAGYGTYKLDAPPGNLSLLTVYNMSMSISSSQTGRMNTVEGVGFGYGNGQYNSVVAIVTEIDEHMVSSSYRAQRPPNVLSNIHRSEVSDLAYCFDVNGRRCCCAYMSGDRFVLLERLDSGIDEEGLKSFLRSYASQAPPTGRITFFEDSITGGLNPS